MDLHEILPVVNFCLAIGRQDAFDSLIFATVSMAMVIPIFSMFYAFPSCKSQILPIYSRNNT